MHFSLYKLEAMLDREESGFLPLTVLTGELKLTRLRLQQQVSRLGSDPELIVMLGSRASHGITRYC